MTGRDVYLAFLMGGAIALLSGYSYARLAARFPGPGGITDYFKKAFPSPVLSGGLSILFLIGLLIGLTMLAKTFGAYASRLALGANSTPYSVNAFASGIIVLVVLTNMAGSGLVTRMEQLLVAVKLVILSGLMVAGLRVLDPVVLESAPSVGTPTLLASVGLTFFAYAGYGIMANASGLVAEPHKTVPRAIFLAIAVVVMLYVGLAVIVLGTLSADHLARYSHTAVAHAADRVFGRHGFFVVSLAALLATTSALNAGLFAGLAMSRAMAERGELPAAFARPAWRQGTHGVVWATVVVLTMLNLLDMSSICHLAGATSLILYLAVFVAHWRLHHHAGGSRLVIVIGAGLMAAVLVAHVIHLWDAQPHVLVLAASAVLGSLAIEWAILRSQARHLTS